MVYKKMIVLGVGAVILAGYVFWWNSPERRREIEKKASEVVIFEDFDSASIFRIEVSKKDSVVKLAKDGEVWKVLYGTGESYPVVTAYMDSTFSSLGNLKAGDIISKNNSYLEGFELSEDLAVRAKFYGLDGEVLYDLYLGKSGPVYPSQYIRFEGREGVILAKEALRTILDRGVTGWRDKKVVSFVEADLLGFSYEWRKGGVYRRYELSKESGKWELIFPTKLDADDYLSDRLWGTVSNLVALDFVPKKDSQNLALLGLGEGLDYVKVILKTKKGDIVLHVGIKDKNGAYYAKVDGRDTVYLIDSEIDILTKQTVETMRKK
ncbi:MAG: hypothetical protein G01um101418_568 [Parcubacteria group bacterium Gr01-1014_18]|nr:MAG: hypothetical protein Greene041636_614 [Parcubacteria group bacterium Greene0416_36]TSC80951.1 MAG: hypothetical protein G01um101418_568 [Parcubacteria group bacterium Gr01-1014_18]TSC98706.1 MAG: hypothetical protein Greene101420_580 [Parcubacteria group bacterium Greene1014_20]TSD06458.1 MAG: hypothetical protein Greene07142_888 [Parcubacteria group bacterium Greene0714_2]